MRHEHRIHLEELTNPYLVSEIAVVSSTWSFAVFFSSPTASSNIVNPFAGATVM